MTSLSSHSELKMLKGTSHCLASLSPHPALQIIQGISQLYDYIDSTPWSTNNKRNITTAWLYVSTPWSTNNTGNNTTVWRHWWLVELPMWLTDGFLVTFFGRWRGQCAYTLIPRVAHVWLPYMVINVQAGGGMNIRKLGKFGNFKICIKVTGSIVSHIKSHEW